MNKPTLLAGLVLAFTTVTAVAGSHTFKDWSVACDNTRHCEAAGFQAEEGEWQPVSLWLARDAGPGTPVQARLSVLQEDGKDAGALSFKVGALTLRGLKSDADLSAAQVNSLLPQLQNAAVAEVTNGKSAWKLSLSGLKAALLKMDDLQGRIDTPGALVRKGQKPESAVLPALPAPVLEAVKLPPTKKEDARLAAAIVKLIKKTEDCEGEIMGAPADTGITRLSATQVLVTRECWRAAYQSGYGFWIANDKPPHDPRAVSLPSESKESMNDAMNADFENGVLSSYGKGRGLGDCGNSMSWLWTAQGFKLLSAEVAPLCRGFPGGVGLRTWVARRAR